MKKGNGRTGWVIPLALFHRYGWIAVMTCCALAWRKYTVRIMGTFFVLVALWSLVGYQLKWKHIYCSNQNASRQEMTPDHIRWDTMKASDAYGAPLVELIIGLACLVIAAC